MEVKMIEAYSLWHAEKKCDLTLTLGCVAGNKGLRWKLKGKYIPFPVRSNTWFCGCDTNTMLEYLTNCGYELEAVVNFGSGNIRVFPHVESVVKFEFVEPSVDDANYDVKRSICRIAKECGKMHAAAVVRDFYNISLRKAHEVVCGWLDECT